MKKELPQKIEKLILDLNSVSVLDNVTVVNIVESIKLSDEDVSGFYNFDHNKNESYGRQLIFDNGNYKILLMSWKPGDFTAIHNHGYTEWGCVYYFGEATHRLYQIENKELKILQKDSYQKGQVASVCGDLTHLMGNSGSENIATLHIYGSNTRISNFSENTKVYVPEKQKIFTTKGTAYLNMSNELILSENSCNNISPELLTDYFDLIKPYYERNNLIESLRMMDSLLMQAS